MYYSPTMLTFFCIRKFMGEFSQIFHNMKILLWWDNAIRVHCELVQTSIEVMRLPRERTLEKNRPKCGKFLPKNISSLS